ncbi:MAG TPA: class I tRNA ligase family protein, partial [Patescibacteria group bacterium]|nr:class I tRNA ligase family protein [Patescibacteria group bacterium]
QLKLLLNRTIKKITEDIEVFHFNTAISSLMILFNEFEKFFGKSDFHWKLDFQTFLKLLSPFAPHITEELWRGTFKNKKSIHSEKWPEYDQKLLEETIFELIVQINGKMRDKFEAPVTILQKEAEALTLLRQKVKIILDGKSPRKVIFIPRRLINIVV